MRYPIALQHIFDKITRKHTHDWLYLFRTPWREGNGEKYMIEWYKCECGATHHEYIPWRSYEL